MKNLNNGDCDVFPFCQKAIDGFDSNIIESCDNCEHWHKRLKEDVLKYNRNKLIK